MLARTYDDQVCSIARALELVGERRSLLIIRDASLGRRRFDEFQQSLGIARNALSDRLSRLVVSGVLERVRYQERPERYEYRLTEKGRELHVALLALMHWGDRNEAPKGPPRFAEHAGCGGAVVDQLACDECGAILSSLEVRLRPGPGLGAPFR